MSKLETELKLLKEEVLSLCELTYSQLSKSLSSIINFDKDLAREVVMVEKRVNSAELKIDRDCEDIFAIYSPVAIDLRLLLAILKINTNLERIGDIAEGIARLVIDTEKRFSSELLKQTRVVEMFDESMNIVGEIKTALEKEDSAIARSIFKRDEILDVINRQANDLISKYIVANPENIREALNVLSIIRKLERVGDQAENIAEEIIFYMEAKVVRHTHVKEKKNNNNGAS